MWAKYGVLNVKASGMYSYHYISDVQLPCLNPHTKGVPSFGALKCCVLPLCADGHVMAAAREDRVTWATDGVLFTGPGEVHSTPAISANLHTLNVATTN
jgi:hypothetical protein